MKFLVDGQLPSRLAAALVAAGHDTIHTSELPDGNRTADACIAEVADRDDRVVVTKDSDFRNGHLLSGSPRRLLVIAAGNITNAGLLALSRHIWTRWSRPSTTPTSSSSPPTRSSPTTDEPDRPLRYPLTSLLRPSQRCTADDRDCRAPLVTSTNFHQPSPQRP